MADTKLTGSEASRFFDVHKYWLNFEGATHEDALQYYLYTVPLGQQFSSELNLDSGSYETLSGAIFIEKNIHQFDSEIEAGNFVKDVGEDNVASIKEKNEESVVYNKSDLIEVQLINHPEIDLGLFFSDREIEKGFVLEVFKSGSIEEGGVRKVTEEVVEGRNGDIISDTYLKFFDIETDEKE